MASAMNLSARQERHLVRLTLNKLAGQQLLLDAAVASGVEDRAIDRLAKRLLGEPTPALAAAVVSRAPYQATAEERWDAANVGDRFE